MSANRYKRFRPTAGEDHLGGGVGTGRWRGPKRSKAKYQRFSKANFVKVAKVVKALNAKVRPMVLNWKYSSNQGGISGSATSAAPKILHLNARSQGTDETNRIGDLCRMKELVLNMAVQGEAGTAALTSSLVRVMIVQEKTALGSAVSLAQLFNSATPNPYDTRNVTTRDDSRYIVHYDELFHLGPATCMAVGGIQYSNAIPASKIICINKTLNFVTDYSRNNNGDITDIDTNSLYLIVITDNTVASAVTVNGSWMLKFLDA